MHTFVAWSATAFEIAGILAMVIGTALALMRGARLRSYHRLRQDIAYSILLGLELLIAADIIATVTIEPTMSRVLVLGLIVLIRTFLSFTLELEATGRLPWQREEALRRQSH
jgi:uncharacterized membrane protein